VLPATQQADVETKSHAVSAGWYSSS